MVLWNDELDKLWFNELIRQFGQVGKRANSGYKKEAWKAALKALNDGSDVVFTQSQLRSRHDILKKTFRVVSSMANASGMGFEAETCKVVASDEGWEIFLRGKSNEVKKWRGKSFPCHFLCHALFNGTLSTGAFSISSGQIASEGLRILSSPQFRGFDEVENDYEPTQESQQSSQSFDLEQQAKESQNTSDNLSKRRAPSTVIPGKRQRSSLGSRMIQEMKETKEMVHEQASQMTRALLDNACGVSSHLTPSEKAVNVLQDEFQRSLDEEDLVLAFEVMENPTKAAMFLQMKGNARKIWLDRQVKLIREVV
ncbi:hypothetical protein AC1031_008392 [Aphanomyces cochlioides]|nr:hypothetical protein AC1031_008392 [Aphanomyces cochlioides]